MGAAVESPVAGANESCLDAAEDLEDWAALVSRVKAAQKGCEEARGSWRSYCDAAGQRFLDPRKHSGEFLRAFLSALEAAGPGATPAPVARPADAEVDGARRRIEAETGAEVWRHLPTVWQPIFGETRRLRYDAARFDFVGAVREMLDCPPDVPLSRLHEVRRAADYEPCPPLRKGMLLAGAPVAPEGRRDKSRNRNKRNWLASPAYSRFIDCYRRYVREAVLPDLVASLLPEGEEEAVEGLEAIVQATPVLRVVMPSAHFATQPHRDADYGHLPEELNYWVPLSPVWGDNSLFCETFPGRDDAEPFQGEPGHAFRFWGNQCFHHARANATDSTRVSFDFRVVPKRFWDAQEAAGGMAVAAARRTFLHEGELAIGSYYRLERAAGKADLAEQAVREGSSGRAGAD